VVGRNKNRNRCEQQGCIGCARKVVPDSEGRPVGEAVLKASSGRDDDLWLSGRHVCYTVNTDWFFLSHRRPLARAAQRLGAEVTVLAGDKGHSDEIEADGMRFVPLKISRAGRSPADNLRTLASLWRTYRMLEPDLIHHVSLKPVVYGSLVARWLKVPAVVNAVSGLGYNFRASRPSSLTERVIRLLLRLAGNHPNGRFILQNSDDCRLFVEEGFARRGQITLIRGSGVDCSVFAPAGTESSDSFRVVMASRMLWSKGVKEFVDAGRLLRDAGIECQMMLIGPVDEASPDAIERAQLEHWDAEGLVRWGGYRGDMPTVFRSARIAVLPSTYREGIPKVLIEAAACGLPIIATDTPGCREIVRDGENGFLIPPGDPEALAEAIARLASEPGLRDEMGRRGRKVAVESFSIEQVVGETMKVYRELLR